MRERNGNGYDFVLTDYSKTLIPFKARQICRRPGFSRSDQEDVEQALWETVVRQADKFDPRRATLDTFLDRVVDFGIRMLLRERRRQKRANGFHAQSADAPANGCKTPIGVGLSDADRGRHNGTVPSDDIQRWEDTEAFDHALHAMPEDVRTVIRAVMGGTISSAAHDLGISRRQVRNALDAARPFFEQAGFGDA